MRAPRPLPLFLELVRQVSADDPELAREALAGLRAYEEVEPLPQPQPRREVARVGSAVLRDHGGSGPPAVLVPSLINPPLILDLDPEVSLAAAITGMGRQVLLLDWGPAAERELSVTGHVEKLLLPLLRDLGEPPALVGYCLGGTMAIAAAGLVPVERTVTLAAPWNFSAYPESARAALRDMWNHARAAALEFGALPMEVLQAAFWSLDPARTVSKFAKFSRLDPAGSDARRFVALEEWANSGEPLPFAAARELIEEFFGNNVPGSGSWQVGGNPASDRLPAPALHFTADHDLIAPSSTAPAGDRIGLASGHVGMIVGSARTELHRNLAHFLTPCR